MRTRASASLLGGTPHLWTPAFRAEYIPWTWQRLHRRHDGGQEKRNIAYMNERTTAVGNEHGVCTHWGKNFRNSIFRSTWTLSYILSTRSTGKIKQIQITETSRGERDHYGRDVERRKLGSTHLSGRKCTLRPPRMADLSGVQFELTVVTMHASTSECIFLAVGKEVICDSSMMTAQGNPSE